MLQAFQAPGRFWRGNLHGHSTRSDGVLSPEAAVTAYRDEGYDFVALTDHFLERYDFPISDTTALRSNGFTTILGAEVHAPVTSRGEDWHILAVGLPPDFPATEASEDGPSLARRCAEAGAFIAIAHPHWYQLQLKDALTIDVAQAVEVYNHTSALNDNRGDGAAMWDDLLLAGRRLSAIAVDDSHFQIADGFGGWVMVKAEANEPGALLSALKSGAFYASQGPIIEDVSREGSDLVVTASPARSISLLGPLTRSARRFGTALTRARLSLAGFDGAWCRIVVTDQSGRQAWTNPLWLDD